MQNTQMMIIGVVVMAVVLFLVIYFLKHANTKPKPVTKSGLDLDQLLSHLGGKENLKAVEANGSKISFFLEDARLVDANKLKEMGASGIVSSKNKVTVIFGKASEVLAKEVSEILH